ncbi:hypothetical protein [Nonomuraea sp. NPDC023979]|uniref:hypothetical protein n=1 Tax=Nonomuraea sp. NPDC023979 TaxID=3154796 RepID=UPI0033E16C25
MADCPLPTTGLRLAPGRAADSPQFRAVLEHVVLCLPVGRPRTVAAVGRWVMMPSPTKQHSTAERCINRMKEWIGLKTRTSHKL